MFTQLLASRPIRQMTTGELVASVALHLAITVGVVYATVDGAPRVFDKPQVVTDLWLPPDAPPPAPQPTVVAPPTDAIPGLPTIGIPTIIPTELPAIPAGPVTLPTDFAGGTRLVIGGSSSVGGGTPTLPAVTAYLADQVEVQVAIARGSPMPRYPQFLRSANIDGSARFRFIVDTLGRVEMKSVEQVLATHEAFAVAVRAVLPQMRFTPARVGPHAVRQLVELPFTFHVER